MFEIKYNRQNDWRVAIGVILLSKDAGGSRNIQNVEYLDKVILKGGYEPSREFKSKMP